MEQGTFFFPREKRAVLRRNHSCHVSGPRSKVAPQRVVFPSERVGPANEGQPAGARNIGGDAESSSLAGVVRGIVSQFAFVGGMAECLTFHAARQAVTRRPEGGVQR